jgi:hypothetical protein
MCHGMLVPASVNATSPHRMFIDIRLPPHSKQRSTITITHNASIICRLAMDPVGNLEDVVYDAISGGNEVGCE